MVVGRSKGCCMMWRGGGAPFTLWTAQSNRGPPKTIYFFNRKNKYDISCNSLQKLKSRIYIRVQRFWHLLRKWRIRTLWWMKNWILRHIYNSRFSFLQAVSCAFGFKVLIWAKENFCHNNSIWLSKNAEYMMLISNPLKKLGKKLPKSYRANKNILKKCTKTYNFSEFWAGEVPGRPHVHLPDQRHHHPTVLSHYHQPGIRNFTK